MIRVEQVSKRFSGQVILDNVSIEVPDSGVVVVLGPSGAGKTVLLKIIAGLIPPDSGKVIYDGAALHYGRFADNGAILGKIGFVFQGGALFDWLNVGENVALPLREKTRLNEKEIKNRVAEVLEYVGMKGTKELKVRELSGGMVKLVAIARALVNNPHYIFFDEPTSGLDPVNRERICELIAGLGKRERRSVVVVTHDLKSAESLTDQFYLLRSAKLTRTAEIKKEDYEPPNP